MEADMYLPVLLLAAANSWCINAADPRLFFQPRIQEPIDPEVNMTAGELITSKGYPCEEHYVETEDGFILNVQRIPAGRKSERSLANKTPVLLQHGLLASSTMYLTNLANESFAYILADDGYDVWLGNIRGNRYSRNHSRLLPSQKEFWEWSWDEMAKYDLPAMVDYIVNTTGHKQIYYVGHSQGTAMAFAGLSNNAELAAKVKTFFALAPVTTVGNILSPIRYLAPYAKEIGVILDLLGPGEFLPNGDVDEILADGICNKDNELCENVFFLLYGFDSQQMNTSRVPVYVAHNPAGTSTQNIIHFAQGVNTDKFQMYDYGSASKNVQHYNQSTPPVYNVSNIDVPVAIFRGGKDWLADPKDVAGLIPKLKTLILNKEVPHWNHVDFLWGLDAPSLCYPDILKIIQQGDRKHASK